MTTAFLARKDSSLRTHVVAWAYQTRSGNNRRRALRLLESANPKSKVSPVANCTRDLQRFIGKVEGEDLFLFSLQVGHGIDPFRFAYARRGQRLYLQKRTLADVRLI